jgi:hypothetical protein
MSILLSVSVPYEDDRFHQPYDQMLIQHAMRAFLLTVVGKKPVVFGGHSSICYLIQVVCEEVGVTDDASVTIYQLESTETAKLKAELDLVNLVCVPSTGNPDIDSAALRDMMINDHAFEAVVFIGGAQDVLDVHACFTAQHPQAKVLAVKSTGGASATLQSTVDYEQDELLDYVGLFTKGLEINFVRPTKS